MGIWKVDEKSEPGILRLSMEGSFTADEMKAFVEAHNRAIDGFRGGDYKVWVDLTRLAPLSPECAALFEQAKRYSSSHKNFRGSSVLVASAMVGLQHRRTSIDGGVMETEMISDNERALRHHLKSVFRSL